MNALIRGSIKNPHAVTVLALTIAVLGILSIRRIPIDILPVFKSPAVQTLTFYGGMSANSIANDISNRMERWTGQGKRQPLRQESRSIIGASIVRNYFRGRCRSQWSLDAGQFVVAGRQFPTFASGHACRRSSCRLTRLAMTPTCLRCRC